VKAEAWCYASGVAAVIETFVLDAAELAELRAAGAGVDDILPRARRSPVYEDVSPLDGPLAAARELEVAYVKYVRSYVGECPDARIADAFLAEYDFRDAANWLKAKHAGAERRPLELSSLPEDDIAGRVAESPLLGPAASAVEAAAADAHEHGLPAARIDLMVDGAFIAAIPSLTEPMRNEWLGAWSRRRQTFAATAAVLRAKWAGVDPDELDARLLAWLADASGSAGAYAALLRTLAETEGDAFRRTLTQLVGPGLAAEYNPAAGAAAGPALRARLDDELTAMLEPARRTTYGPERVFAFLWSLARENRGLREAVVSEALGEPEPAAAT
jgi:hypothetical protein